jgi:hypothetical protein
MVFIANEYEDIEPVNHFDLQRVNRHKRPEKKENLLKRQLLIMGWNRKIPALIQEFDSYENENFTIDLLSKFAVNERKEYLSKYRDKYRNVQLNHLEGDYTSPTDLSSVNPEEYDNIIMLGNSWLDSNEEADARTILGYLVLRDYLTDMKEKPEVLIELMDPDNEKLFHQRSGEVLISPLILSHMLAHVALRRDLNVVFDELFTVGGAEIYFRNAGEYQISQQESTFLELKERIFEQGDIALGVLKAGRILEKSGGISLNPPNESIWDLEDNDELIVLTTYE